VIQTLRTEGGDVISASLVITDEQAQEIGEAWRTFSRTHDIAPFNAAAARVAALHGYAAPAGGEWTLWMTVGAASRLGWKAPA
jgi:hypothetical protein